MHLHHAQRGGTIRLLVGGAYDRRIRTVHKERTHGFPQGTLAADDDARRFRLPDPAEKRTVSRRTRSSTKETHVLVVPPSMVRDRFIPLSPQYSGVPRQ